MSKNQAAFPSPGIVIDHGTNQAQQGAYEGMSLRDYFAAKAMGSIIANPEAQDELRGLGSEEGCAIISKLAYMQAEAMLAAREVSK